MTAAARRGTTTVADKAVRKIAERAAGEALPGPAAGRASGSATVHGRRASVALRLPLPYPAPLSDTARRVQRHVTDRTRELTGLGVAPARLTVTRLTVPSEPVAPGVSDPAPTTGSGATAAPPADEVPVGEVPVGEVPVGEPPAAGPSAAGRRAPRRWWSARRAPVAGLILPVAAGCAAVTADVVRVHAAHRPAAAWRTRAVEWLSAHGPGELPVVVGGAAVAVLGFWMLVLALTPGRRHQVTLAAATPARNVAVDRTTVAALLRDTVGDVDGVAGVRVRVRRRRATVRAALAFGDREEARAQAVAAAHAVLADCLLRRTPRLRVRLTPEPTWQPPDSGPPPSTSPTAAASDPTAPSAPASSSEPADGTSVTDTTGTATATGTGTGTGTAPTGDER
ncbi:DUF6286 domain-containing protein [Streptomyces qinglanensis]|uniref:DUF6286 domain-containing Asp23/Gls24 family envelope stress response protein n=1 Tax=Streptomyces qinglanensis TaxID=943816 RepID=UPI003D7518AF